MGVHNGYSTPHSTQSWAENCGHELIYCPSSSQTSANQRLQSDTRRIIPQQEPLPELPMLWSKWKCKNRSFELACTQVQRLVMQKILCRNQTCWFLLTCLIVSRHKHPIRNLKTPTSTQVFTSWNFAYHWWDFTSEISRVKANAGILKILYTIWGWTIFSAHLR